MKSYLGSMENDQLENFIPDIQRRHGTRHALHRHALLLKTISIFTPQTSPLPVSDCRTNFRLSEKCYLLFNIMILNKNAAA